MKKIALFIDIDNAAVTNEHFENVIRQVYDAGSVLYGKVYGLVDRKHKEIVDFVQAKGFDVAPVMRLKKRGSRALDIRMLVDIMEMVVSNSNIDTVAVVCAPGDWVPLFAKLREYGVGIMAPKDLDKESLYFVDEYLAYDQSNDRDNIDELADEFFAEASFEGFDGFIPSDITPEQPPEVPEADGEQDAQAHELPPEQDALEVKAAPEELEKPQNEAKPLPEKQAQENTPIEESDNAEIEDKSTQPSEPPQPAKEELLEEDRDMIELLKNVQRVLSEFKENTTDEEDDEKDDNEQ